MGLSANRQRAAAYFVCALFALAYMGNSSEFCGMIGGTDCPSRLSAVIAMGVLTFLSAAGLAVLTGLDKLPRVAEAGWALFTALLNTCGMAIVSSPRSYGNPALTGVSTSVYAQSTLLPALLFSIVAEVAIFIGLYVAVADDDFDPVPKSKLVDPPAAAPVPPAPHVPAPAPAPMQSAPVQTMPPPGATVPPPV